MSFGYATPVRTGTATANTGTSAVSSFPVSLPFSPKTGNTLVALVCTRGTTANRVTGILQTGVTWTKAVEAVNTALGGLTTEIWYAAGLPANAGTTLTINLASALRAAAIVTEYRGVLTNGALDRTSSAVGNVTSVTTGTTAITTQGSELWIGAIDSSYTLGTLTNGFASDLNASSTSTTTSQNAKVFLLERTAEATGVAFAGATAGSAGRFAAAIATFKAAEGSLTLSGSAAANYSLEGTTGTAFITPMPLTVTAVSATKTYDGTVSAVGTPSISPGLAPRDVVMSLTQSYQDSNAGSGNKILVPYISINDGNGGASYSVTLRNHGAGTILPAPASISLDNLDQTYDGTPKYVLPTTNPAGKAVSLTYSGLSTPPTEIGQYLVEAVIADPNYQGTSSAMLSIHGLRLVDWQTGHFSAAEIAAGKAALHENPDGDGFSNLAEYALGGNPGAFTQPLAARKTGDGLELTFERPKGLPDVTYFAESSTNLIDWQPCRLELVSDGPIQTMSAVAPVTSGSTARMFIWLRFTAP